MARSTFQFLLGGKPADEVINTIMGPLEVEENADLPGSIQVTVPLDVTAKGDLTFVGDSTFAPFAELAVVVTVEEQPPECIFAGYVLAHKVHLQTGTTASTLQVWGQDASWRMNLEEKVSEWADMTDAAVANKLFDDYGIKPALENLQDESPSHPETAHTLIQRATDIQFLRNLARRNGKLCRVAAGSSPSDLVGYFAKPLLESRPTVTLKLNDPTTWNVDALDIEWDIMRPSAVNARQALFTDAAAAGVGVTMTDSGLPLLDKRNLAEFAGATMSVQLTAPVDDAGELALRAQALLREAGWFVRCEGECDVARLKVVLRVGQIVQIAGIGALHSGKYYVWSVRHTITPDAHRMKFVLLRNAVGS